MANCYRCGRRLEDSHRRLRRKVKTGEWVRRRYVKPSVQSAQTSYGMRIVCRACARSIDLENGRIEFISLLQVLLALAVLFGLIVYWSLS